MVYLKSYLSVRLYYSLEFKGCPLSVKTFRGITSRQKNTVKLLMTAFMVVENIWNRKEYLQD